MREREREEEHRLVQLCNQYPQSHKHFTSDIA